ncbi:bifunctional metallophosphatase/5'-nucleotidase [Actinocorallia longicatena]|uniref:Bifunctional metallophosphatase/5'-nucleotidase n=2 Tax=Actinocorallia longicatena TaxID=111803 RepID=A0ABP6QTK4_9ACTN
MLIRMTRLRVLAAAGLAVAATLSMTGQANAGGERLVPVRLLALNDFHGNLEPPTGSSGRMIDENGATVDAGGAVYAAAWMKQLTNENTLKVAQGDLIGASPLVSAAYHDEPSLEFLGDLGITASAVGNHEFDEGYSELKRLIKGGSHPVDGDTPAGPWQGTKFTYLGANVLLKDATELPDLPGYEILQDVAPGKLRKALRDYGIPALPPIAVREINGVKIGFIGAVTETTPTIVTASGIQELKFGSVVKSAEFGSRLLDLLNVKAQVLLVHEGDNVLTGKSPDACSTTNDPDGSSGNGTDIATQVDPEIDLILSGHSHQAYVCKVKDPAGNDRLYSQGGSFGRVISQADFKVDRKTGQVDRSTETVDNQIVTRTIAPDPATAQFVQLWKDRVSAVANRKVGDVTADLNRVAAPTGETTLGDVIADAQLEATVTGGGAQIALMNPGGVRNDLVYAPDGVVTYGESFAVQPFSNLMQVVTLTGDRLDALLEQQWTAAKTTVLQPSKSLSYTYSPGNAFGSKVSDIKINGVPVVGTDSYRVAANNFLVGGGDGFSVFLQGTDLWSGPIDLDAFNAYLGAHSPVSPPALDRITLG